MTATHEGYVEQIRQMALNKADWLKRNPAREVLVQFNHPPHVAIIITISEAVAKGFVSTNEAGLELLKALWDWDADSEPTVTMVRIAMEAGTP